jgi:hypothetical protein
MGNRRRRSVEQRQRPDQRGLAPHQQRARLQQGSRRRPLRKCREGITLTALGFDIRQASLSTAQGPYFIVQTQDGVNHIIGGCSTRNIQPAPAAGWTRFRFNAAHASPAISPGETVKAISLMMDQGPDQNSGHAVLDNLNINDKFIGHE